jgi:hypothetical protein
MDLTSSFREGQRTQAAERMLDSGSVQHSGHVRGVA